jgi:hypothetical protein
MLSEKMPLWPKRRILDLICMESIRCLSTLTLDTWAIFGGTGLEDIFFKAVLNYDIAICGSQFSI